MSIIDLNQLTGTSLLDAIQAEPCAGTAHPDSSGSFNDYLQRAQTFSSDTGNNSINNSENDAGRSSVPRTEGTVSTATAPSLQNNNGDELNGTDSAGKTNLPETEEQQLENKQKPAETAPASSRSNKVEKDKKDKSDGHDSPPAGNNQDIQAKGQINPDAVDAKNNSPVDDKKTAGQAELNADVDPSHLASKDTKKTIGTNVLTEAESLTAKTSQIPGVEETDAVVPASMKGVEETDAVDPASTKGGASKKVVSASKDKENMEKLSPQQQAVETISALAEDEISAGNKSKGDLMPTRDPSRRSARRSEKKDPPAARLAEATASPAAAQEAPTGAAAVNSAALQAAVNAPGRPTKPVEIDLVDNQKNNTSSKNNDNTPTSDSLRLGPASAKTQAATTQHKGNESGSQSESVRFVQRVERAFAAMGDRGGTVRLKLSPPELGSVRMEISVNKGVMKARFEAETKEAKNLLLENLPALRDRLAQQNIKIQKFDVDLRDPSSGGMPQQTTGQAETGSRDGRYRAPRPQTRENSGTAQSTAGTARLADHSGQLNVII